MGRVGSRQRRLCRGDVHWPDVEAAGGACCAETVPGDGRNALRGVVHLRESKRGGCRAVRRAGPRCDDVLCECRNSRGGDIPLDAQLFRGKWRWDLRDRILELHSAGACQMRAALQENAAACAGYRSPAGPCGRIVHGGTPRAPRTGGTLHPWMRAGKNEAEALSCQAGHGSQPFLARSARCPGTVLFSRWTADQQAWRQRSVGGGADRTRSFDTRGPENALAGGIAGIWGSAQPEKEGS